MTKLQADRAAKNNLKENAAHAVFFLIALMSISAVILICGFLFYNGIPAIQKVGLWNFLSGNTWAPSDVPPKYGIHPMILGSIYITGAALFFGVPLGILAAVFMARFCPKKIYALAKPCVNLLAGIPSIVYGFFGMVSIVPLVRKVFGVNGSGILTAGILLGIMILPTIIGISESALRAVPNSYYEASLGLGASHERAVFFVELPAARSGILASVILGIGRAVGETMAVIMVAGNQARVPDNILQGVRSLTANIVLEMSYATDLHRGALIATGVVLFVFIMIINVIFSILLRRFK
ncbi:phosphate transport system permease protein [Clostridia bacterium]|nr:phosphate transport system permease protein [Clostridia bacterium]